MCLDRIIETGLNKSGFGWKVFTRKPKGGLHSQIFSKSVLRPRNRWLKANRTQIHLWRSCYFTGFHIFLHKSAAKKWGHPKNVVKVKYRKGHTLGQQEGIVIVADEMLILTEERKGKCIQ